MKHLDFKTAQKMLMAHVHPVQTERLPLSLCGGRILAEDLLAAGNIPPFDRKTRTKNITLAKIGAKLLSGKQWPGFIRFN